MIKIGDTIKLGEHRVVCGDSKDPAIVKKLMDQDEIRVVLTDPPYGISYVQGKDWLGLRGTESKHFKKHKKIESDDLTGDKYAVFTEEWIKTATEFLTAKNAFYIFNSDMCVCDLRKGMEAAKIYYSQMIIWVKNSIVLGRKDYNPQHELIIYGWHGRHKFEASKRRSVIYWPKPHRSTLHPTMKPVGLLRKLILNSTKVGEVVYDPFGGSGSTLIACEQTKRKCLMIELEPEYCEKIKWRYERYIKGVEEATAEPEEIKK